MMRGSTSGRRFFVWEHVGRIQLAHGLRPEGNSVGEVYRIGRSAATNRPLAVLMSDTRSIYNGPTSLVDARKASSRNPLCAITSWGNSIPSDASKDALDSGTENADGP